MLEPCAQTLPEQFIVYLNCVLMKPLKQLRKFSGWDSKVAEKQAASNDFNSFKKAARTAGFCDRARFADPVDPEASA